MTVLAHAALADDIATAPESPPSSRTPSTTCFAENGRIGMDGRHYREHPWGGSTLQLP
ncbi:hypothetical protein ACSDR0_47155 [Streptosporangium sp. G11]|uniref:hypothetical protein n=1 Tax=Streptosporangium sp. G11 TaxID=3436926 RepID=UPI003EBAFB75